MITLMEGADWLETPGSESVQFLELCKVKWNLLGKVDALVIPIVHGEATDRAG